MKITTDIKLLLASGAAFAALLAAGACNTEVAPKTGKPEPVAHESTFKLDGTYDACGEIVSLGDPMDDEDGGRQRPVSILFQVAVCGKVSAGSEDSAWSALGMTFETPEVYVREAGEPMEASAETRAGVVLDGDEVVVRAGTRSIAIGRATARQRAYPIELDDGVKVELAIKGEPYKFGKHSKGTPDSDKELWITLSR